MAIIVNSFPQSIEEVKLISMSDVLNTLPDTIEYALDVWIGGKLARYGQTSEALAFLVYQDEETSTKLKLYFEKLMSPYPATVSSSWKNERITALKLYNKGKLIIDRNTLRYTEAPTPTVAPYIITLNDVLPKLPKTIQWKETVYLTGSLVKCGWSGNDVDFMVDTEDRMVYSQMRKFFENLLGLKVDVGNAEMPDREPVYKAKLYEDGQLCDLNVLPT